ncbi:TatD family hydrolase [bacterium]|nr:TatD family hydrolase [bacterium]
MFIDSHAHLNISDFDNTRNKLIPSLLSSSIQVINVGVNKYSSKRAVEIAEEYDKGVFASVGLHPLNIRSDFTEKKYGKDGEKESELEKEFDVKEYKKIANASKVVAIGEIGLDYWHRPKGESKKAEYKKLQMNIFNQQLDLAEEMDLPVIIHSRSSFDDTYDVLQKRKLKGVLHCFIGERKDAERFLDMGYVLGINGVIFRTNMDTFLEWVPMDKILLETDCPYLTPPSFDSEINNPFSLSIIAQKIADIKAINRTEVEKIITKNTKNLFNI